MPIAVSKKCCWCCWRLYQHWHPTDPKHTPPPKDSSDTSPDLFLSGSHSIIYPWCPPPIGIPFEFLTKLKEELHNVLIRVMNEGKSPHHSRQTSAHSSGDYSQLVRIGEQAPFEDRFGVVRSSFVLNSLPIVLTFA